MGGCIRSGDSSGGNDDCICMYMGICWSVQLVCALMMKVFVVKVVVVVVGAIL